MFRFSISDVGIFLGKAPATLRSWERKGLVTFPRVGNERACTTSELMEIAGVAYEAGRISGARFMTIDNAIAYLKHLETE